MDTGVNDEISAEDDREPDEVSGREAIPRRKKFPMVMMLEPLHACNLTCTGCGRIREYKSTINEMLTVEQCLAAVEDCGAPIVSICGGEPMIYPEIGRLAKEILARKKHIYLCTNGMFIRKRLHEFKPTSSFFFNVHLDGLERTHDLCVERDGVFREAIEGIKAAKAAGFLVCSNTTIYKETDIEEIAELYAYLRHAGRGRQHAFAGVRLRRGADKGHFHVARRKCARNSSARASLLEQIQHDDLADLHGIPAWRARTDVHGLGQSDVQPARLEGPLLLDDRRAPSRPTGI